MITDYLGNRKRDAAPFFARQVVAPKLRYYINHQCVADLKQRFNLFRYQLELDFSLDKDGQLDHRLGLAAAILFGIIEGRQE